jgi:hypothetical protein
MSSLLHLPLLSLMCFRPYRAFSKPTPMLGILEERRSLSESVTRV